MAETPGALHESNTDQSLFERRTSAAMEFCQNLDTDSSSWEGVQPLPERRAQVIESMQKLVGFRNDVKKLDKQRWIDFQSLGQSHEQITERDVRRIIKSGEVDTRGHWIKDARVLLNDMFNYTETILGRRTWNEFAEALEEGQILEIVSSFLRTHVGEHDQRVVSDTSVGFDGVAKSCPVSLSPGISVRYFTFACAEYILMNSIKDLK
ncbi:MAG: hypothetical protein ABI758_05840 [Candidatus Woesebacteria bacterium]